VFSYTASSLRPYCTIKCIIEKKLSWKGERIWGGDIFPNWEEAKSAVRQHLSYWVPKCYDVVMQLELKDNRIKSIAVICIQQFDNIFSVFDSSHLECWQPLTFPLSNNTTFHKRRKCLIQSDSDHWSIISRNQPQAQQHTESKEWNLLLDC